MFCQGVSNILSIARLHKIPAKYPRIRFWHLLLPSGKYMSLGRGGNEGNAGNSFS
jgi:hypothetical protein